MPSTTKHRFFYFLSSTTTTKNSPGIVGLEPHAVPSGLDLLQVSGADDAALEDGDLVALARAGVDEREGPGAAAWGRANRCRRRRRCRSDIDWFDGRSYCRLFRYVDFFYFVHQRTEKKIVLVCVQRDTENARRKETKGRSGEKGCIRRRRRRF